jgi:hypothetical protein
MFDAYTERVADSDYSEKPGRDADTPRDCKNPDQYLIVIPIL